MNQYMLLIKDDLKAYSRYSKEELGELIGRMSSWSSHLREKGVHAGAEKLTDDPGRVITRSKEGKLTVDGPFTEVNEIIGGFFIINAASEEDAIEIAMGCPALQCASEIEVRCVASTCDEVILPRGK